jgi:hypothetical protein
MNKYFICFTLLILPFSSFSEEDIESNYRKNYIEKMTPIMMEKMIDAMPEESLEQIEKQTNMLVTKMAGCQYESVENYPKEYWNNAIIPIAIGEDMTESLEKFESFLSKQVERGNISQEEIVILLETTKAKLEKCIKS